MWQGFTIALREGIEAFLIVAVLLNHFGVRIAIRGVLLLATVSMIPFLVVATLFSYFGLARRKWQQGESND